MLFFEKFKFDFVARTCPQTCVVADRCQQVGDDDAFSQSLVKIVVDCGYSATWIVPILGVNACFPKASKRVDVGGKLLTNLLKEELSWRQVNVMDDTYMVEKCKRDVCYVAKEWKTEKPSFVDYLLPDHSMDLLGRIVQSGTEEIDHDRRQLIRIGQERINVPEVLFAPSRIGLEEAGIAEAVYQCVMDLPWELQHQALSNVLITGGTSNIPGFVDRLRTQLLGFGCSSVVDWSEHYQNSAWRGGALFANSEKFVNFAMSKKHYEEEGSLHRSTKKRKHVVEAWWEL